MRRPATPLPGSVAVVVPALVLVLAMPASPPAGPASSEAGTPVADGAWVPLDPGPRMSHTLTADPARRRAIQFGGWDGEGSSVPGAYHDETWVLDLAAQPVWRRIDPAGPKPGARIEHVAVRDVARDRLVVFGGRAGATWYDDLWAFDLAHDAWSPLETKGEKPEALETRGVYDPVRDRVLFFGGHRRGRELGDLWQLSLADVPTWSRLEASGIAPSPRRGHAMIYDPVGDRVIVFGGFAAGICRNDVWELRLSISPTWNRLVPEGEGPDPRYGHAAVYDARRQRLVVLGGFRPPTQFMSDAWALDLSGSGPPAWTALDLGGPLPPPRDFAAAAYDVAHDRVVLHGGTTMRSIDEKGRPVTSVLGDLWVVTLSPGNAAARVPASRGGR